MFYVRNGQRCDADLHAEMLDNNPEADRAFSNYAAKLALEAGFTYQQIGQMTGWTPDGTKADPAPSGTEDADTANRALSLSANPEPPALLSDVIPHHGLLAQRLAEKRTATVRAVIDEALPTPEAKDRLAELSGAQVQAFEQWVLAVRDVDGDHPLLRRMWANLLIDIIHSKTDVEDKIPLFQPVNGQIAEFVVAFMEGGARARKQAIDGLGTDKDQLAAILLDRHIIKARQPILLNIIVIIAVLCFVILLSLSALGLLQGGQTGTPIELVVYTGVSLAVLLTFLKFDPVRDSFGYPRYVLGPVGLMLLHYMTTSPTL